MKNREFWKLSILNVLATPLRSVLTVTGFAVGVAAILAVLTLGDAGKKEVVREMSRLGIDKIWVTAAEDGALKRGAGEELAKLTGASAAEHMYMYTEVHGADGKGRVAAIAGMHSGGLSEIRLKEGRIPCAQEWEKSGSAALAGEVLAAEMKLAPGDLITAFGRVYQVCGIAETAESVASLPLETALILPLDEVAALGGGMISEIRLTAPANVSVGTAEKLISRALLWQNAQADVSTMEIQMEAASGVTDTFVNVLGWVAFVCVLVGGIGVMNILLVSVRERRREIGLIKAIGGTGTQVGLLFLLEAVCYALLGGILGILLGMVMIRLFGAWIGLDAVLSAQMALPAVGIAALLGVIFGVAPALRAAGMLPVDALKSD